MKGDAVSHNHSATNVKSNSSETAKDDSDRMVVEEHHGDASLAEGEEDAVIY